MSKVFEYKGKCNFRIEEGGFAETCLVLDALPSEIEEKGLVVSLMRHFSVGYDDDIELKIIIEKL